MLFTMFSDKWACHDPGMNFVHVSASSTQAVSLTAFFQFFFNPSLTETSMASQCISPAVCSQPIHCPAQQPLPSQPKYILLVSNYWPPNTKIQIHFDPTTHIAPKYTRPCLHPLIPKIQQNTMLLGLLYLSRKVK